MSTVRVVFGHCLRLAVIPAGLAALVGAVAVAGTTTFGEPTAAAQAPWLHLPAFVAALCCCAAAVACWPTFSQRRPGVDWVLRLERGPLHGCGAASAGALLALLLLLLAAAGAAAVAAPVPYAHRPLAAIGEARLDGATDRVTFDGQDRVGRELWLRPVAYLPRATPEPVQLQLFADGTALLAEPLVVLSSQQPLRVRLPAQPVRQYELRRLAGNLPLLLPEGSVVLVEAAPRSRLLNGMVAAVCYLLPAGVALVLAALAAPAVALPLNLVLVFAALLLQTLGNLGPAAAGIAALLGGRWLPAEPLFQWSLPSLGTGITAMILAMALRRRLRR